MFLRKPVNTIEILVFQVIGRVFSKNGQNGPSDLSGSPYIHTYMLQYMYLLYYMYFIRCMHTRICPNVSNSNLQVLHTVVHTSAQGILILHTETTCTQVQICIHTHVYDSHLLMISGLQLINTKGKYRSKNKSPAESENTSPQEFTTKIFCQITGIVK